MQEFVRNVALGIPSGIRSIAIAGRQGWWLPNPSNPRENFAEKWNSHPERKLAYPGGAASIKAGCLAWEAWAQPTPVMRQYKLRLEYQLWKSPKMWVVEPNLSLMASKRTLPHLYDSVTQQLCLYQPAYDEWKPNQLLVTHLIPWAVQWLYYFELWVVTDVWHGNGEHPRSGQRPPI